MFWNCLGPTCASAAGKSKSKTGLGYRERKTVIYKEAYKNSITCGGSEVRGKRCMFRIKTSDLF